MRFVRLPNDDAYAQLGSGVPAFTVTSTEPGFNGTLRAVNGTFDVPMYLTGTGEPGSRLVLDGNGMPERTGTFHASFRCLVPSSAVDANGHGGAPPLRHVVVGRRRVVAVGAHPGAPSDGAAEPQARYRFQSGGRGAQGHRVAVSHG